jgi:hypothetical protein
VRRTLIASAGISLVLCAAASAQLDHLQCYKVDPDTRVVADVDLAPAIPELPAQAGCRLKGPKLFCGPVAKTIIQAEPPAAGAPAGPEATSYLCYKARCQQTPGTFQVTDQFATYMVRSRKSFLLCAPARVGPPTTTTTIPPTCGITAPTCGGTCPAGQVCVPLSFGPAGTGCACAIPPVCALDVAAVCGGNCPPGCLCFSPGPGSCGCLCV